MPKMLSEIDGRKMVRKKIIISFFCFLRAILRFSSNLIPGGARNFLLYEIAAALRASQ
jgi:hypothetical protein